MAERRAPTDPDDVDGAWLTDVLVAAGQAPAGARVERVEATRIGVGKVGDNVRFALSWQPEGAGPPSVVGKFPSPDPTSRAAGISLGNYEREVRFYQHLAPTLAVRAPACFAAELDDDTGLFCLLLEDLAPAEVGDQLVGCTPEQARAAVDGLVGLHAPRWGDPELATLPWLSPRLVGGGETLADAYRMLAPMFVGRYRDQLHPDAPAVVTALVDHIDRWVVMPEGPVTVTHNDYRLDNLLFAADGRVPSDVAVVDWQTVGLGPGIADVSYALGAGLVPEDRRLHERALVDRWIDAMTDAGCAVDPAATWHEYRRSALAGLVMAVFASAVVGADDRSDAMFCTMASRHALQALDLDTLALLA